MLHESHRKPILLTIEELELAVDGSEALSFHSSF